MHVFGEKNLAQRVQLAFNVRIYCDFCRLLAFQKKVQSPCSMLFEFECRDNAVNVFAVKNLFTPTYIR